MTAIAITTLADEYRRQYAWRAWSAIYDALPLVRGQTVLDLGCGVGDQARDLASLGVHVIGVDANTELVDAARARHTLVRNVDFRRADLRSVQLGNRVDGIWCSFTAAYFVDFAAVLDGWLRQLRAGGWIALVEVDDLFAHAPLAARTRQTFDAYADDARAHARYDFHMGRKLTQHLARAGLTVMDHFTVSDRELAFDGRADAAVVDAWRRRFERMQLLRDFCNGSFEAVRDEFLACLARSDHRSHATVRCAIARRA